MSHFMRNPSWVDVTGRASRAGSPRVQVAGEA
jgi:hypothetical protein